MAKISDAQFGALLTLKEQGLSTLAEEIAATDLNLKKAGIK